MSSRQRQKELDTYLKYCLEKRLEQLEANNSDEKYQALVERNFELYEKLFENIPEKLEKSLKDYNISNSELSAYIETYFYRSGFIDAVKLAKTILNL